MTLAQRIVITNGADQGVTAVALAALMLFSAIVILLVVGLRPIPVQASAHPVAASPISNAHEPACAAALARARDTRGLPAEEAIAASTAMLRACDIR